MIEGRAVVTKAQEEYVWVEAQRQSECRYCGFEGCDSAVLAEVLGKQPMRVRVLTQIPLCEGDEVIIGISENTLVKISLIVYLILLLSMLFGAILGDALFSESGEGVAMLLGVLGCVAGFVWLFIFARQTPTSPQFQPVVLRRSVP
jgi:sigma-E factor negative regulatory protein RseC